MSDIIGILSLWLPDCGEPVTDKQLANSCSLQYVCDVSNYFGRVYNNGWTFTVKACENSNSASKYKKMSANRIKQNENKGPRTSSVSIVRSYWDSDAMRRGSVIAFTDPFGSSIRINWTVAPPTTSVLFHRPYNLSRSCLLTNLSLSHKLSFKYVRIFSKASWDVC